MPQGTIILRSAGRKTGIRCAGDRNVIKLLMSRAARGPGGKGGERAVNRTYIAIDLKSFYASVECQERGLDPLTTNLVVADLSRTEKTI